MSKNDDTPNISERLLYSDGVRSLVLETKVYDSFKNLGWSVQHSPYYVDTKTGKFREVDVTARKFWIDGTITKYDLSCNVYFICECKSIKDYHVIASNKLENKAGYNLFTSWIGDESYFGYPTVKKILLEKNIGSQNISRIIEQLELASYPDGLFKFSDKRLDSFEIPIFNSYRETNIGATKELDNSVIWKAFQSILSCFEKYNELIYDGVGNWLIGDEGKVYPSENEMADAILDRLLYKSSHIDYIHPLLVVESQLWELTDNGLTSLKYFRLIFQKMFEEEIWIDIVNKEYLNEYLSNINQYDEFLIEKGLIKMEIGNR